MSAALTSHAIGGSTDTARQPASAEVPAPAPRAAWLLGRDPKVRSQVHRLLFSFATYLVYGGIGLTQMHLGLLGPTMGWALIATGLIGNLAFYGLLRTGWAVAGRDPGLARTQLLFGVLLMYPSYLALGPAASGLLVVMASHVVYSMFMMRPRQVWQLVGWTLAGLAAAMLIARWCWPTRFDPAVQLSDLLYALLVMPLIALLAYRVTGMTQRLTRQHTELQAALARLQELATRDELTRAHNRRHMTELLQGQQSLHRRLGQPLAIALIDIDLFKRINDQHGHAVGDEVLRRFAELTRRQLRAADLLARWGGEEFLIALPHTGMADGLIALERLQQRLREASDAGELPAGLSVSFSAGVAEVGPDEPLERAIERADQAMYRAKTGGRARCLPA
jgi:diguanylate cyclase (GGDEF)-like protein